MVSPPLVKGAGVEGLSFPQAFLFCEDAVCEFNAWGCNNHSATRRGDGDRMWR